MSRLSERIELLNSGGSEGLFNLSATGAALFSPESKKKDSRIALEINGIRLEAKVVYCQERTDGFRLGVKFDNLSGDTSREIADLVDKFSRGVPLSCRIVEDIPAKA